MSHLTPSTPTLTCVPTRDLSTREAVPWSQAPQDVLAGLGVTADGLALSQAAERLEVSGPNRLPEPAKASWLARLWHHLKDTLILVLLGSAAIKLAMQSWVDGAVILGVVLITVAIGMIQEGRAEKSLNAIKSMLSPTALARRDGTWSDVAAETLVPGDIIRVKAGDRVPADARLIEATNLQVEEAALTGESVAAEKSIAALDAQAGLGDRVNMLFSSTIVVAGTGTAVITATGASTEIGRIQDLISSATDEETPLARTMAKFGKKVTVVILALAAAMGLFGWFVHAMGWEHLLGAAIGVAVAAIPEGLPAVVTITLALGVKALAQRNSISRNLTSTETLGSVSTICSDKTGTLTQNEMTVRVVRTATEVIDVTGTGYAPHGELLVDGRDAGSAELTALAETMVLCNDAIIAPSTNAQADGLWSLTGEPTEGAVLSLGYKAGFRGEGWTRLAEVPFDSATKYMATLVAAPSGERHVMVKGALDAVLGRCTTQLGANGPEPLDVAFWQAEMETLAAQGLRVLAAARTAVGPQTSELPAGGPSELVLVGIVGIVDPPRPSAIHSIAEAHQAGIDVKMITGDHVVTAKAIAVEMGIADGEAQALTGPQLETMSDEDLAAVVRDVNVFARVSPEHKIRIVRALQSHGEIVAMTGDGVNDAPALTQANVGVAMGITGTEATKAAADLVLLDDNFSTIEKAIFEGRRIFDNIRKSAVFALSANVAQVAGILLSIVLGWAHAPLQPVQVLWINMVVAVCLGLPFATEQAEPGLMHRKPRDPNAPLINGGLLRSVFTYGLTLAVPVVAIFAYEFFVRGDGLAANLPSAQSAAISMLTLSTVAYVFSVRFLSGSSINRGMFKGNRVLGWAILAIAVLHAALMYIPAMNSMFQVVPTSLRQWAIIVPASIAVFLLVEMWKWVERTVTARREARRHGS